MLPLLLCKIKAGYNSSSNNNNNTTYNWSTVYVYVYNSWQLETFQAGRQIETDMEMYTVLPKIVTEREI